MSRDQITNRIIAEILSEISIYLEMQDVPFKPRAYEKVAEIIGGLEEEARDIYEKGGLKALEEIPGVGVSIAEKIEEIIKTGRCKYYEDIKKKTPVRLEEFGGIEGLGPKSIKKLYQKLGIKGIADLEKAARAGKISRLDGFGKKSEENILKGIEFVKKSGGRFVLGSVMPTIETIEERLRSLPGVEKTIVAGSTRRSKETIGDADILVVSKKPAPIMDYFVEMPEVAQVHAHGATKSSIKIKSGMDIDLRVVRANSYGAALNYFTGSKDHNVALRKIAISKGYKLNEYGLFKRKKQVAGKNEEELYKALGMDYIEPEMRENTGEIELARKHALPVLVGYNDLRGDLQVQTEWTDGSASIENMALAARKNGLEYIVITDHTKRLAMTHGLDEKRILKQMAEIDRLNKKFAGKIKILKGSECDILKDGSLDLPDNILAKLDVVGASVHSYFNLPRAEQTARIKRAMENKNVDIIFHPTGRIINRREAYEVDMDELIKAAKKTGTIMEIDAYPDRLDLKDDHIRKCVEMGVKMSIDSDAHSPAHFPYLEYGIAQARRGWAERKDIINAWPVAKMLEFLK
ncbi:MAG: DNA polymerase/3'-5' exonuclease PolX [Patescibacteria group bacterium]|nr:DNA polymerase/3'-5' exonuclease PolX [Patescibacteria group bacterium]MDE2015115.1 DNA polymerase/3'-5' exonuclease PolX [Patescibacteria group bacterium]MDE2226543.1 DNA polymerase/3'-5' exonuclease PolX [Patescibacteria group bacterium]